MNELFALWNELHWMDGWGLLWMPIDVGTSWWIMVDARRRGRGWVRWLVFAWLLWLVAIAVWLFRRRRWPVSIALDRRTKLKFAGIALAVLVADMAARTSLTYNFLVARVEGQAMASTLNDQDRLLVNKAVYRDRDPAHDDIIMLRYPLDPEKSFVVGKITRRWWPVSSARQFE